MVRGVISATECKAKSCPDKICQWRETSCITWHSSKEEGQKEQERAGEKQTEQKGCL